MTNFRSILIIGFSLLALSFPIMGSVPFLRVDAIAQIASADCGKKLFPIEIYERISYISLVAGFALIFLLTVLDGKTLKMSSGVLSVIAFSVWGYIYFAVDYDEMRRNIFNFNVEAESALNNIAEAQDRYKSEQGVYLDDLKKLHSHVAGASGLTRCVNILEIKVYPDYWTAIAQQVSSPDKINWDSRKGSSLKKG